MGKHLQKYGIVRRNTFRIGNASWDVYMGIMSDLYEEIRDVSTFIDV